MLGLVFGMAVRTSFLSAKQDYMIPQFLSAASLFRDESSLSRRWAAARSPGPLGWRAPGAGKGPRLCHGGTAIVPPLLLWSFSPLPLPALSNPAGRRQPPPGADFSEFAAPAVSGMNSMQVHSSDVFQLPPEGDHPRRRPLRWA
jgi:hypothetical protein